MRLRLGAVTCVLVLPSTSWLLRVVRAAKPMAVEPVWAAMVAFFAMGETMSNKDMIGAILIVGAGMVNELDIDGMLRKDKDIVN